jgi:protein-L-isoaspartate(D-aspartate) O-methyltransferase
MIIKTMAYVPDTDAPINKIYMQLLKSSVLLMVAGMAIASTAACGGPSKTADTASQQAPSAPAAIPSSVPVPAPAATPEAAQTTPTPNTTVGTASPSSASHVLTDEKNPPSDSKENFVAWMVANRGEDKKFLGQRWDRYQAMLANGDLLNEQTKRAFLMTPREEFVRKISLEHSYDNNFLDIGFGVTISGPHAVGRMTSTLEVQKGDKVLEVGTGSGFQSAILSQLTDQVWTIEIIEPLAARTRSVYDGLIERGYSEYKNIHTKQADGYYGWEEAAPFDKIIVTCGIDHIPPSLLQQLKPGGVMVIPVGPPAQQHVLKVTRETAEDGSPKITRSDIYNGRVVPFVPFTKLENGKIVGSHNGSIIK